MKTRNNSARSWTWLFFDRVQDENTIWAICQIPNDLGEVCKHHVKIINGSTGNSINHLSNVHGITKENYKEKNNFLTKVYFLIINIIKIKNTLIHINIKIYI